MFTVEVNKNIFMDFQSYLSESNAVRGQIFNGGTQRSDELS